MVFLYMLYIMHGVANSSVCSYNAMRGCLKEEENQ